MQVVDWECASQTLKRKADFCLLLKLNIIHEIKYVQYLIILHYSIPIRDDRPQSYILAIENCATKDAQMIMCVAPNNRSDR